MGLTKYKLGSLIEYCDCRNNEDNYGIDAVMGISTGKELIITKANMDGVSLSSYKLVKSSEFSYVADTSRRGDKIAIAFNDTKKTFIISSIYTVFKVKRKDLLDSRFLFMFFNRPEFDRYARFNSWGSARETFNFDDMCDVEIPIPDITIQRSIANIYEVYVERKEINERLKEQIRDLCPILIKGSIDEAS